jgi:transcription antitermination factor NusG
LNGDAFCAVFRAMPFWSVVRSLPQREKFAAERVQALNYPVFLPLVPSGRKGAGEGRPLFAGYFFAQISSQWRPIATCVGVLCILKTGDCPAKLPDREVEALRNMVDAHGFVRLPDAPAKTSRHVFKKNERVKIIGGPFQGVAALHSGLSAAQKEILLISMLGAPRRISVPSSLIVPA